MRVKQTYINLVCSLAVLVTNIGIAFFLQPFIVENIGVEANGFVVLANDLIMYANLVVTALNSMAARFITIAYVKGDKEKALTYYNSVFWGNLLIVIVALVPAVYIIYDMEHIFSIPPEQLSDIKILFGAMFAVFLINTAAPNWECGTYVTNRLDRAYMVNFVTTLVRAGILVFLFSMFFPHVWYVGVSAVVVLLLSLILNAYNTYTLIPFLRIDFSARKKYFSFSAIKILVGSGVWNSVSNIGHLLLNGLDMLICNMYLGSIAMGQLALSRIMPNLMQQLSISVCGAFAPELVIDYASANHEKMLHNIRSAMKITLVFISVPLAGIVIFGDVFFSLWVKGQDAELLQVLSVLALLSLFFTTGTQILYNVFPAVNRVKENALAMLGSGLLTVCFLYVGLVLMDLGLYAVAAGSSVANIIRNMSFTVPFAAKYLNCSWNMFFREVYTSLGLVLLMVVLGLPFRYAISISSWMEFLVVGSIYAVMGWGLASVIVLSSQERQIIKEKTLSKVIRIWSMFNGR